MTTRTVQQHSDPVEGTFTLSLNGIPLKVYNYTSGLYEATDIPYKVDGWQMKVAFRNIGF
jgi:hypothetical protein